ncbi:peptidylprolyl isomerase [Thalassovita sp.]|mgnify:CR=1 FL=1|jgi:peptidyl-prolyl cis-trans isomerase C|uniref:peptidylprolyl isomerase n=1 Tax=Thalassovita sp. TaxID=1979401 RepID=UPI003B5B100E
MSNRVTFLSGAVLSLFMALPAVAEDKPGADTVIASVNGTEITLGHMILVQQNLPQQYQTLPSDVLFNGILDQIIQQTVLAQSAPEGDSRLVRLSIDNERRALKAGEVLQVAVESAINDVAVQELFDAKYADGTGGREFNASHILVETEEKALELIALLEGGADFAELAKEHSTGPSGPNGGQLGWFGEGMMVPPFEKAVLEMAVGAISVPVKTQFGWHVIKLNDARTKAAPTLDEVRAEIEGELENAAIDARIKELTDAAKIVKDGTDIDPALVKRADLLTE